MFCIMFCVTVMVLKAILQLFVQLAGLELACTCVLCALSDA